MNDFTLVTSKVIAAPKSKVWDAIINPEIIKQYLFGTEAKSDWKVGSTITYSGMWEGKSYEDKGNILAMETEKFFKYNYWSSMSGTEDKPENYAEITYELSEEPEGTLFTLSQSAIPTQELHDHHEKNWKMVLEGMKKVIEQ
ncbi:MAG: SRPBCC domain-containing protein [Chitinophagales bacterium]|nr:SRPBCC domain-containing protein [Chitinophagales bacterium]